MSATENGSAAPEKEEPQETRSPEEIQADIEQTRQDLGESVDALAHKLDVKSRTRDKVDASKQRAADQVQVARRRVSETAARGKDAATDEQGDLLPVVPAAAAAAALVVIGVLVWRWRR